MGICGENEKLPIANPDHAVHFLLRSPAFCGCILRYYQGLQSTERRNDMLWDWPRGFVFALRYQASVHAQRVAEERR